MDKNNCNKNGIAIDLALFFLCLFETKGNKNSTFPPFASRERERERE